MSSRTPLFCLILEIPSSTNAKAVKPATYIKMRLPDNNGQAVACHTADGTHPHTPRCRPLPKLQFPPALMSWWKHECGPHLPRSLSHHPHSRKKYFRALDSALGSLAGYPVSGWQGHPVGGPWGCWGLMCSPVLPVDAQGLHVLESQARGPQGGQAGKQHFSV